MHTLMPSVTLKHARKTDREPDQAGGQDHGAPGVRPPYSGSYHAAFVIDPDGHNIEAVFHEPGV